MDHNRIKYFIFDFDGVVADTENVFAQFDCQLLNEVLENANLEANLTVDYIRTLAGNNDESKFNIIANHVGTNISAHKKEYITKRTKLRKTLFKDIQAPLGKNVTNFIEKHKGLCALATNKTATKLNTDIRAMGLETLFDIIITCDPPMQKKPAPTMLIEATKSLSATTEECAYIGDNILDMQAAINANMLPIGFIIEGIHKHHLREEALRNAGAALIYDDFSKLEQYFEAL